MIATESRLVGEDTGATRKSGWQPRGEAAHRFGVIRVLAVAVWVLATAPALTESTWLDHYHRGLAFETTGSWTAAIEQLRLAVKDSFEPRRLPGPDGATTLYDPHFHLARCLVETGRYHEAGKHLAVSSLAGLTPREQIAALRARIEGGLGSGLATSRGRRSRGSVIDSDPPGARVIVDGRPRGITPLDGFPLPPGTHAVRLEAPGFRPWEQTVVVGRGQPAVVEALLEPVAPVVSPVPPEHPTPASLPSARLAPTIVPPTLAPTEAASSTTPTTTPLPTATPTPAGVAGELEDGAGTPRLRQLLFLAVGALVVLALTATGIHAARRRTRPTATDVTVLNPAVPQNASSRLGGFELHGVLGRGGMATTYRARRLENGAVVALKVPHEGYLADPGFVTRFLREGLLGEQLHHPRIVRIQEAGEDGGRPFLAMELLPGRTLKHELQALGRLPLHRALEIARDIAEALDYAHLKGVVHRDLKPENVMVLPDGSIRVMDFGIARLADQPGLTASNMFLGTPLYAAPESVDPKHVDQRVDLYALGIILFEMLEGTVPFVADSPFRVLEMHMREPLPEASALPHPVPPAVWSLILRLCEKDRDARYATAEDLLVDLNRILRSGVATLQ
jgi:hypothetical protein